MSFAEVMEQLPSLTLQQRQVLVRRALELDDSPLSLADEVLVENRLAAHRQNPASSVPLETMKTRLRAQFTK